SRLQQPGDACDFSCRLHPSGRFDCRAGSLPRARSTAGVLETISRQLGVTAATLTGWHDAFLAAGEAALTTRAATGEELESDRLKTRLGAALIERDLLNEKIAILEAGRPFARRRRAP